MLPRPSFVDLPPTAVSHFKLCFYGTVLHVIQQVAQTYETWEAMFEEFPFLAGYNNEIVARGLKGLAPDAAASSWQTALLEWEEQVTCHLPLRALRQAAGLDYPAMTLLLCVGLVDEDVRFGLLFEAMQGTLGQHRPTTGLLQAWWKEAADVRGYLRQLQVMGLVQVANPDAPRVEWALQLPAMLWDILRGEEPKYLAAWISYRSPTELIPQDELVLPRALRQQIAKIPALLDCGDVQALIVRGPRHNGRHTVLGAVARSLGWGMLEIKDLAKPDDERWALIGPLAAALRAMPAIELDLTPGETTTLPMLNGYDGPLGVILGKHGGVQGPDAERALTLVIDTPSAEARYVYWQHSPGFSLPGAQADELRAISERFRLTSGAIQRTAHLARAYAALASRPEVVLADVQQASSTLNRQALESLAVRENTVGTWQHLAVGVETMRELANLESRCRHRETLHSTVGSALGATLNPGVRALFNGPSGTGKTLAARLLASTLQMDLYRVDLSSVVNKYIGETEKSLNQLFTRAEEQDVILLIDEGDALLTRRTDVHNSNDRYANLETNFLLQRLESFEGIVIVTTNAGDRIDSAFQRRMDAVIEFRLPEAQERWTIWQLHLPDDHSVERQTLMEIAGRCAMTGGQIRNAVLHASLLSLDDGRIINSAHVLAAVQREYRKAGEICPLRSLPAAVRG